MEKGRKNKRSKVQLRLLSREHQTLHVTVHQKPTGADLSRYKGGSNSVKTSVQNSRLWFGDSLTFALYLTTHTYFALPASYHTIPKSVIKTWSHGQDSDTRGSNSDEAIFSGAESDGGGEVVHVDGDEEVQVFVNPPLLFPTDSDVDLDQSENSAAGSDEGIIMSASSSFFTVHVLMTRLDHRQHLRNF